MKPYRVYKHPDNRLVAVKEGFSFPGFFFGGFWLLWHKVWVAGSIAVTIGILVYFIFPSPQGYFYGVPYGHRFGIADLTNIGIELIIGFVGNELRLTSLYQRGFELVKTVMAATPDDAKAKYLRGDKGSVERGMVEHTIDI
jgi:Protein of unknown function (DUF2628)